MDSTKYIGMDVHQEAISAALMGSTGKLVMDSRGGTDGALRSDPDGMIRRMADLLDIGHERIRLWTFARAAAEPRDDWSNEGWIQIARATTP